MKSEGPTATSRFQLRFSMVALFSVIVIVAIPLAIWRAEVAMMLRHRIAGARVAALGGTVSHFNDYVDGFNTRRVAVLQNHPEVDLSNTVVGDDDLSFLDQIPDVDTLILVNTRVTDNALERLAGLKYLTVLRLDGTRITDKGLAAIGRMEHLEQLGLRNTQITDDGLHNLTALTNLFHLNLCDTAVSDAGLKILVGLPDQKPVDHHSLWLAGSKVTASGVAELKKARPRFVIMWP
ncbi:MAG TPA: hypothetical protein VGN12_15060 [Pirellulales bacterium]|jgi:hypothetical protein